MSSRPLLEMIYYTEMEIKNPPISSWDSLVLEGVTKSFATASLFKTTDVPCLGASGSVMAIAGCAAVLLPKDRVSIYV